MAIGLQWVIQLLLFYPEGLKSQIFLGRGEGREGRREGGGSPPPIPLARTLVHFVGICISIAPVQPDRFKSVNLMITTTLQNLNTWYKTICPVRATVDSYFTVITVHSIKVGVAFH